MKSNCNFLILPILLLTISSCCSNKYLIDDNGIKINAKEISIISFESKDRNYQEYKNLFLANNFQIEKEKAKEILTSGKKIKKNIFIKCKISFKKNTILIIPYYSTNNKLFKRVSNCGETGLFCYNYLITLISFKEHSKIEFKVKKWFWCWNKECKIH